MRSCCLHDPNFRKRYKFIQPTFSQPRQITFEKSRTSSEPPVSGVACFHCGELCEQDTDASQGKSFCCVGCQTVYELLQANNLCGYYNFEKRGIPSFKRLHNSRFDFLDDEIIRPQLIQFSDGIIARTTLRLPRIHCASCIWLLENLFKINPAILRAEVNFLKKEIAITFREQEIKLSEIATLLTKLGYEPEILLDARTVPNQALWKQMKQQKHLRSKRM